MKVPTTKPNKAIVISLIVMVSGKKSNIYPMNDAIFSLAQFCTRIIADYLLQTRVIYCVLY
jgi:hypothetical protein